MVQIFDCVEFNRDLRCADVASDLAFLLMDLTRLGTSEVATSLLGGYREAGMDLPDELLRLYSAHRALVRAKITCLQLPGQSREGQRSWRRRRTIWTSPPRGADGEASLVAMTGLSGTGKSTVARRLARALGARLSPPTMCARRSPGSRDQHRPLGGKGSTVPSGRSDL